MRPPCSARKGKQVAGKWRCAPPERSFDQTLPMSKFASILSSRIPAQKPDSTKDLSFTGTCLASKVVEGVVPLFRCSRTFHRRWGKESLIGDSEFSNHHTECVTRILHGCAALCRIMVAATSLLEKSPRDPIGIVKPYRCRCTGRSNAPRVAQNVPLVERFVASHADRR